MIMETGDPGEAYNIGSEVPIQIGQCLQMLISMAKCQIKTEVLPALLRPSDIFVQTPCIDKFKKATNWVADYSLVDSLTNLLNYKRAEFRIE